MLSPTLDPRTIAPPADSRMMLGDQAAAQAALDAGIVSAYGYPGTPSTEALEFLLHVAKTTGLQAHTCANEKAAMESALGSSLVGGRSLVTMKHVGLNVAMDPFVSGSLVGLRAGLVLLVADDPGMHSSQDEQDSRALAAFARVPCLEPANVQEAYDLTREAFRLSEHHRMPVVLRLVTRIAHARAPVRRSPVSPPVDAPPRLPQEWTLLPGFARKQWDNHMARWPQIVAEMEAGTPAHVGKGRIGVITAGLARAYFEEVRGELAEPVAHLHLDRHPLPMGRVNALAAEVETLLILEDGYPVVEDAVRGTLPTPIPVHGRTSGHVPMTGELSPDRVRAALGLPVKAGRKVTLPLPGRPPQLCQGCPHGDSFHALLSTLHDLPGAVVTGDIGCYTLGALTPFGVLQSAVCMGASIGMAKGAVDAGARPVVAIIGDGTFLHSGVQPLMDAITANADMTVLILDNQTIAMTGGQDTAITDSHLRPLIIGLGADPAHVIEMEAHPRNMAEMTRRLHDEVAHPGLSVVIAKRECIVSARHHHAQKKEDAS